MRLPVLLSFALLMPLLPGAPAMAAEKPSFDCAKAGTAAEKLICRHGGLAKADAAVAAAYKKALGRVDSRTAKALAQDQRWFVGARDGVVEGGYPGFGDAKDIEGRLKSRAKFLEALQAQVPDGMAGKWLDAAGGFDISANPDGTMKVSGNAVDPVSARWVCDVEGPGKVINGVLEFRDADDGSLLKFSRDGQTLKVTFEAAPGATDSQPGYCGMGGSLDGSYFAFPADYKP